MDMGSLLEVFWSSVNARQPVPLDFRAINSPRLFMSVDTAVVSMEFCCSCINTLFRLLYLILKQF